MSAYSSNSWLLQKIENKNVYNHQQDFSKFGNSVDDSITPPLELLSEAVLELVAEQEEDNDNNID